MDKLIDSLVRKSGEEQLYSVLLNKVGSMSFIEGAKATTGLAFQDFRVTPAEDGYVYLWTTVAEVERQVESLLIVERKKFKSYFPRWILLGVLSSIFFGLVAAAKIQFLSFALGLPAAKPIIVGVIVLLFCVIVWTTWIIFQIPKHDRRKLSWWAPRHEKYFPKK